MRFVIVALLALFSVSSAAAQTRSRESRIHPRAHGAERAIRSSMEGFERSKAAFERNLQILLHLRAADTALADDMQPATALQRAYEHVEKAFSMEPPIPVFEGVLRVKNDLESARRSPTSADFGRLRSVLHDHAVAPASRVASSNALALEEEILAWTKVQQLIVQHIAALSSLAGDSLRAMQHER